jgi:hypothetical protein
MRLPLTFSRLYYSPVGTYWAKFRVRGYVRGYKARNGISIPNNMLSMNWLRP